MAISTNPKPTIYRNLYENTGPVARICDSVISDMLVVFTMHLLHQHVFSMSHRTVCFIIGQGFIVNNYTLNKSGNLKVLCRKIKQVRFRIFLGKELCFIVIYSEYIHTAELYLLSITI